MASSQEDITKGLSMDLSNLQIVQKGNTSTPVVSYEEDEERGITVTLWTDRLRLEQCQDNEQVIQDYKALLCDPIVMQSNAWGEPYELEFVTSIVKEDAENFKNRIPFGSLSVYLQENDNFVGKVSMDEDLENPGTTGLFYAFKKEYWNSQYNNQKIEKAKETTKQEFKGIGKEAVTAVVNYYAPELVKRGKKTRSCKESDNPNPNLDEQEVVIVETSFNTISTTVRQDNQGSIKILEAVGMERRGEGKLYNGPRYFYRKNIK